MTILLEGCHCLTKGCIFPTGRCANPCQHKVAIEVAADIAICTGHHFNTHTGDVFICSIEGYGVAICRGVGTGDNDCRCVIYGQFCTTSCGCGCDSSGQPGWLDIAGVTGCFPERRPFQEVRLSGFCGSLRIGELLVQLCQHRILITCRALNQRRVVFRRFDACSRLCDVIEERKDGVKVLLANRVVFMVVAACAAKCHPKPDSAGGFDAVDDGFDAPFFGDYAAFGIDAVVTVEPGGDDLFGRGIREHVSGELFDSELVIGLVGVEGIDDPVTPAVLEALVVSLIAI